MKESGFMDVEVQQKKQTLKWGGATIKDLKLPCAITISSTVIFYTPSIHRLGDV